MRFSDPSGVPVMIPLVQPTTVAASYYGPFQALIGGHHDAEGTVVAQARTGHVV